MKNSKLKALLPAFVFCLLLQNVCLCQKNTNQQILKINNLEYLEIPGLNVMLAHDYYPGGHQSGISIIQNGVRVGSNGDMRLEPTPGPGHAQPKVGKRMVDREKQTISVQMEYPDPDKNGCWQQTNC